MTATLSQKQRIFHRDARYPWTATYPLAPTETDLDVLCDPSVASNPLSRIIGQPDAKRRLSRACRSALKRYNHCLNDMNFLFTGPKGVGKTSVVRKLAERLGLPLVEVSPSSIKSAHDLWTVIETELSRQGLPLVPKQDGTYMVPPCVIFVDECHELKSRPRVVTALLKAVAQNDRRLLTEKGIDASTILVCWVMATTDRGDLFDALDDRFTEIALSLYTQDEVAEIVELNYGKGNAKDDLPEMPPEACALVAHFRPRQPRKALEFAREVRMAKRLGVTWKEAIEEVRKDCRLDQYGWDERLVKIITILGTKPVAKERLPVMLGCKEAELRKFHLPFLLTDTADQRAYVGVCGDGYTITEAGLAELDKRGIANRGRKAMGG